MQVLLVACGSQHLPHIARALQERNALAGLWVSDKNQARIPPDRFRRAWLFHLAMKPFYHLTPVSTRERIYHALSPLWRFWVRRQKPPPFDVVHAIMGYGAEVFDFAEKTGALKVIDASSSHPTSFYGFWQRECDIWCPGATVGLPRTLYAHANRDLERADLIACPSLFVRDSMIYNGIPESKCILNHYGVNTSIFTPRTAVPLRPRFVCVGGICLRKGHQYLFRAFEKVREVLPDAELVCAGPYHADFRREKPRWQGTFTHYPSLPHPELAALLRESTAFVLPSNEEGFARAIIEAMAAGLPVIATHQSGATTLVEDGVEGLIVPARDVQRLAEAMLRVATNRQLNQDMGRAAHARGARNNSWTDYADRLIQNYTYALDNLPSRSTRSNMAQCRTKGATGPE
jgi:glycosyltransferase involved in cell wall biosynthesis